MEKIKLLFEMFHIANALTLKTDLIKGTICENKNSDNLTVNNLIYRGVRDVYRDTNIILIQY